MPGAGALQGAILLQLAGMASMLDSRWSELANRPSRCLTCQMASGVEKSLKEGQFSQRKYPFSSRLSSLLVALGAITSIFKRYMSAG